MTFQSRFGAVAELIRDARTAAKLEFSPRLPPWSRLPMDPSAVSRLRYAATHVGLLAGVSRRARIKLALLSLFWPVKATFDAVVAVIRFGPRVKGISGIGFGRQFGGAMALAHVWNFSPKSYYSYRFWDPAIRPLAPTFLQPHEFGVLQMIAIGGMNTEAISSKAIFATRCAAAGIPTPTLVATFTKETEEWCTEMLRLPRRDLFIKRVNGMQGIGGERWVFNTSAEQWSRKGTALTETEMLAHCRHLAVSHSILVQHCLANHPELAKYSSGSLSTFRVMTYLEEDQAPALLGLTLKMARLGSDIDNIHAGGIGCPVDALTGNLGPGVGADPTEAPWREHPDTHGVMDGARLTVHREVIALALTAHAKLDVPWSVGWDVAMTPEGPILVEGNSLWAIDVFHLPHRVGVKTEFAEALLKRINQTAPHQ